MDRDLASISSADSGLFSDEEERFGAETKTLVSNSNYSRSFSTDSSTEFSPHLETICEGAAIQPKKHKKKKKKIRGARSSRQWPAKADSEEEEEEYVPDRSAGAVALLLASPKLLIIFKFELECPAQISDLQELLRCF